MAISVAVPQSVEISYEDGLAQMRTEFLVRQKLRPGDQPYLSRNDDGTAQWYEPERGRYPRELIRDATKIEIIFMDSLENMKTYFLLTKTA